MLQLSDPFDAFMPLREVMNRLFEESFVGPHFELLTGKSFPVNVYETPDKKQFVVEAALPGFKPEQIHVQVADDILTIRADRKQEQAQEMGAYVCREITQSELYRTIRRPASFDVEAIEAIYEHGVLTLHLPKTAAALPKQIPVKAKELAKA